MSDSEADGTDAAGSWDASVAALQAEPSLAAAEAVAARAEAAGTPAAALPYLDRALAGGADNGVRILAGRLARAAGRSDAALAYLHAAQATDPERASVYNDLGLAYLDRGALAQARHWLRVGIERAPDSAGLVYNLARVLDREVGGDDPLPYYEQAVALAPQELQFWRALVRTYEHRNELGRAWAALERAEEAVGARPSLLLLRATLAVRNGELADARAQLDKLPWAALDGSSWRDAVQLAAQIHDRCGEVDAAMACFAESNRATAAMSAARQYDKNEFLGLVETLQSAFTPERMRGWQRGQEADRLPVFLVGFPRSATTLIEMALAQHSQVTVIHERGSAGAVPNGLRQLPGGYPEALFGLSDANRTRLRQLYGQALAQVAGPDPNPVIVDKLPLDLVHAGALQAVFPEARFIFCLRHPADVVLSCFMQGFEANEAMNNFYNLADAAHAYDRVMSLWEQYRRGLPLRVATVPYEAILADFAGGLATVLDFLGLPWEAAVTRYYEPARSGHGPATPSYSQVAQSLYSEARYRWQRYSAHLAPHLPLLRSWAAYYGYREASDGSIRHPEVAVAGPA